MMACSVSMLVSPSMRSATVPSELVNTQKGNPPLP